MHCNENWSIATSLNGEVTVNFDNLLINKSFKLPSTLIEVTEKKGRGEHGQGVDRSAVWCVLPDTGTCTSTGLQYQRKASGTYELSSCMSVI